MATLGFHFALVLEPFEVLAETEKPLGKQDSMQTETIAPEVRCQIATQADLFRMPLDHLDYLAAVVVAVETDLAQVAQLESLPLLLDLTRLAFLHFALHSTGQRLNLEHLWHGRFDSGSWH
jgi:hypothetical protein